MQQIYVVTKGHYFYGPFCPQSIKKQEILSSDIVWYDGLTQWTPVLEVDFLRAHVKYDKSCGSINVIKKLFYHISNWFKKILGLF